MEQASQPWYHSRIQALNHVWQRAQCRELESGLQPARFVCEGLHGLSGDPPQRNWLLRGPKILSYYNGLWSSKCPGKQIHSVSVVLTFHRGGQLGSKMSKTIPWRGGDNFKRSWETLCKLNTILLILLYFLATSNTIDHSLLSKTCSSFVFCDIIPLDAPK